MINKLLLSVVLLFCLISTTYPVSKIYNGKPIPTNQIIDGMQIIEKEKPFMDLDQAPLVTFFDKADQSLKFTIGGSDHPDSVLYHVIPGDRISVQIAASVTWDKNEQLYHYIYEVRSLEESAVPIEMLSIHLGFEPTQILNADGWISRERVTYNTWSNFNSPKIMPGDSVSGFGYRSFNPPKLGIFNIRGERKILFEKGEFEEPLPYITNYLGSLQRVECLTLIPAPKPEKIHADSWISNINYGVNKMISDGYIPKNVAKNMRLIVSSLQDQIYQAENPPFSEWNGYIESTLADLAPYQSQIEPEAWSYITENLKYMQRNKDIVWFGK